MKFSKKIIAAGLIATSISGNINSNISYADNENAQVRSVDYRTITANSVNFRKGPSTSYASMGKFDKGDKVEYISKSGVWFKVKYGSKTGYVHSDYVTKTSGGSSSSNNEVKSYKIVTANSLNVRSGAGTNHSRIGSVSKGTKVGIISESKGWAKIKYGSKIGYVSSDYLKSTSSGGSSSSNNEVKSYKIVTANSLNVRSGAGTNHSRIGSVSKGTKVGIISESKGWAKIKYGSKIGYVSSDYLKATSSGGSSSSNNEVKSYKIVTANSLNVRSGAGTNYSRIGSVSKGTKVGIISESKGWAKIKYGSKIGYVSSDYLKSESSGGSSSSSASEKAKKVISLGKTLLNKPYVWGAEGPNSFDCSGYTQYVFKKAIGVNIPRVSRDQSKFGTNISRNNIKPGDLLFFDTDGPTNNGYVSHVGIYMGDNKMIHASSSKKKVVISELSSYYNQRFVNARRVL